MQTVKMRICPMEEEQMRQYLAWRYAPPYDFYNIPAEHWEEELQKMREGNWFAVLKGEKLHGFYEFTFSPEGVEIGLGLSPEAAGWGEGTVFMRHGLEFLKNHFGYRGKVMLRVLDWNARARKVYERTGFRQTGTEQAVSWGRPVCFLRYERVIGQPEEALAGEDAENGQQA